MVSTTAIHMLLITGTTFINNTLKLLIFFFSVLVIGKINEASLVFSLPSTDKRLLKKKILNLV